MLYTLMTPRHNGIARPSQRRCPGSGVLQNRVGLLCFRYQRATLCLVTIRVGRKLSGAPTHLVRDFHLVILYIILTDRSESLDSVGQTIKCYKMVKLPQEQSWRTDKLRR